MSSTPWPETPFRVESTEVAATPFSLESPTPEPAPTPEPEPDAPDAPPDAPPADPAPADDDTN